MDTIFWFRHVIRFCFWLLICPVPDSALELSTDFENMTEAFCPDGFGVSNIIIHKNRNDSTDMDFRFTLTCTQLFDYQEPSGSCRTKYSVILPHYDLSLGDDLRACSCQEYLAGIKTYPYELKENGILIVRERRLHLRCCAVPASGYSLGTCFYTGMRYLLTPWPTELRASSDNSNACGVIQSLMISGNYIVAKSCLFSAVNAANGYGYSSASSCDKEDTSIKTEYPKCNMMLSTPFRQFIGPAEFVQSDETVVKAGGDSNGPQAAICRDGHYVFALMKRSQKGSNVGEYSVDIECRPLTYHYCYCFWRESCADTDVQWYLAGVRSHWDYANEQLSIEQLCCTSNAVHMSNCNSIPLYSSNSYWLPSTVNASLRYQVESGKIIRHIGARWERGLLLLTADVCDCQLFEEKGCQEPCKECAGPDDAYDPICTPSKEVQLSTLKHSSTNEATTRPLITSTQPGSLPTTTAHIITTTTTTTLSPSPVTEEWRTVPVVTNATVTPVAASASTSMNIREAPANVTVPPMNVSRPQINRPSNVTRPPTVSTTQAPPNVTHLPNATDRPANVTRPQLLRPVNVTAPPTQPPVTTTPPSSNNTQNAVNVTTHEPLNITLPSENITIAPENFTIPAENITTLPAENVTLSSENVTLTSENATVTEENITLTTENLTSTLSPENVTLATENNTLSLGNVTLPPRNLTRPQLLRPHNVTLPPIPLPISSTTGSPQINVTHLPGNTSLSTTPVTHTSANVTLPDSNSSLQVLPRNATLENSTVAEGNITLVPENVTLSAENGTLAPENVTVVLVTRVNATMNIRPVTTKANATLNITTSTVRNVTTAPIVNSTWTINTTNTTKLDRDNASISDNSTSTIATPRALSALPNASHVTMSEVSTLTDTTNLTVTGHSTLPTPTRPTCSLERNDGQEYCPTDVEPENENASIQCRTHCYGQDGGHYRGASCLPAGQRNERMTCWCRYDPCRNSAMDIVFLLDSSGSLEDWGFIEETEFLTNFISKMTLGKNESRVALVQFSTGAEKIFTFADPVQSLEGVRGALDNLYYDAGDTNITAAFVTAAPLLEADRRQGVPQIAVLITDGIHNQGPPSPAVPASRLREEGVLIYAVGIGPEASSAQLVLITGDNRRVFMAQFADLDNVLNVIGAEVTAQVNN